MVNQQLLDYIKQQSQQGISQEQIKSSLMSSGWQEKDIEEGFAFIQNPVSQSQPVPAAPSPATASLPGAAVILGQAWGIYRRRIGTFLGIMAIPLLITIALIVVLFSGGLLSAILLSSKIAVGGIGLLVFFGNFIFCGNFLKPSMGTDSVALRD